MKFRKCDKNQNQERNGSRLGFPLERVRKTFKIKAKNDDSGDLSNEKYNQSCSINIFFTAGSYNHAIPAVLPATMRDNIKATKILLRCCLTYSL